MTIELATSLRCSAISAEWHAIDAEAMARATTAGLEVAAWTVRDPDDYRRLESLGVSVICAEAAALDG